jgi:hypothetical protein
VRYRQRYISLLIFPFLLGHKASSQSDSTVQQYKELPDSNAAGIYFERNYNTFLWNLNAGYSFHNDDNAASFHEGYSSSFIQNEQNSLSDQQTVSLAASQKISEPLWLAFDLSSFILSSNQSLDVSNAGIHSGLIGINYKLPFISISPLAGIRFDRQQSNDDHGWDFKLGAQTDTVSSSGYESLLSFQLNESNLSPRYFRDDGAAASIYKDFGEGSFDSIRVDWSDNRRDFYVPADTNVEQEFGVSSNIRARSENDLNISNSLTYGITPGVSLLLYAATGSRTITNAFRYKSLLDLSAIPFTTIVQESNLAGSIGLQFKTSDFFSLLEMKFNERDEKHTIERIPGVDEDVQDNNAQMEEELDNSTRRTTLNGFLGASLSRNDFFSLNGSMSILHYDTPDTLNTDDRDELFFIVSGKESHRFSEELEASLTLEATLTHLVYLYSDKSANNNWNRIFRLSPSLAFTPYRNFTSVNTFEVLANYTVYDFETIIPNVQSYSYRQFAFLDSTLYDMTNHFGLDLFFNLRLYERGELQWQQFSEQPQQYVEEATFSPEVRYTIERGIVFAVGFRSFAQRLYSYNGTAKIYNGNYFSFGPTTMISMALANNSSLLIQGWKEFQEQSGQRLQDLSNVTMTVKMIL